MPVFYHARVVRRTVAGTGPNPPSSARIHANSPGSDALDFAKHPNRSICYTGTVSAAFKSVHKEDSKHVTV